MSITRASVRTMWCITAVGLGSLAVTPACVGGEEPSDEDVDALYEGFHVGEAEQEFSAWRNDQSGHITPAIGYWGNWRDKVFCNEGMWAVGYWQRVEAYQGSGDDTALNSVALLCVNPVTGAGEIIASHPGQWGTWAGAGCSGPNNFLKGARVRMEPPRGGGDDTAANDVLFTCTQAGAISAGNGQIWGDWGPLAQCPNDSAVCGLQIRFEDYQSSGDDTAMNGLELECCYL